MNTKKIRKMILYMKYIIFLLEEECNEYDKRPIKKVERKYKKKK